MSQRDSGYERKERDLYETPAWVTQALLPHIPGRIREVYEPAAGSGKMVRDTMMMTKRDALDTLMVMLMVTGSVTLALIVTAVKIGLIVWH